MGWRLPDFHARLSAPDITWGGPVRCRPVCFHPLRYTRGPTVIRTTESENAGLESCTAMKWKKSPILHQGSSLLPEFMFVSGRHPLIDPSAPLVGTHRDFTAERLIRDLSSLVGRA